MNTPKLPCCGEHPAYGHANACVNRPKPVQVAKPVRTVKLSKSPTACIYCGGATRKGSVAVDGDYAHVKCQREQMK